MQYTTNYGLKKPQQNDRFLVSDINDNADTIDELFGGIRIAAPMSQSNYDDMSEHDPLTLYIVLDDEEEEVSV